MEEPQGSCCPFSAPDMEPEAWSDLPTKVMRSQELLLVARTPDGEAGVGRDEFSLGFCPVGLEV